MSRGEVPQIPGAAGPPRLRAALLQVVAWHIAALAVLVGLVVAREVRDRHALDGLLLEAGRAHGVDPRLLSAVIWKESRYQPGAVGAAGERGLMQVMEPAAREWHAATRGKETPFDPQSLFEPRTNVHAGAWYLGRAIRRWRREDDPLARALAEYNAGPSRARAWDEASREQSIPFREAIDIASTRAYIEDVLGRYRGRGPR